MNRKRTKSLVSISLVLLSLSVNVGFFNLSTAQALTYYVAPNGDDSNPGTIDQPWRTIQHAAVSVTAGNTILLRTGVYNEQVIINQGGGPNNYISFSAYQNEKPVIDGINADTGNNGFLVQASYIKISGLEFRNWPDSGICCWKAGFLEISNCNVHDCGGGVSLFDGSHDFSVSNIEVYGTNGGIDASPSEGGAGCYNGVINDCIVHDCSNPDGAPDGISLGHGDGHNFVINRCVVYNFFDGFDISGRDVQINSCKSYDNYNTGFKVWEDNVTLTNCLTFNNSENNLQLPYRKAGTVTLQNCDFVGRSELQNIWIQNETHGLQMYNCILVGGINVGLDIESMGSNTYRGDYNIFQSNDLDRVIMVRDQDQEFSLDMIAAGNWTQFSGQDQHSLICSDPSTLFENLASWNLHLKQGSIAIDAGTPNNSAQLDYDSSSRPYGTGYDIGAYEFGSNSTVIAPSAVTQTPLPTQTNLLYVYIAIIVASLVAAAATVVLVVLNRARNQRYQTQRSLSNYVLMFFSLNS